MGPTNTRWSRRFRRCVGPRPSQWTRRSTSRISFSPSTVRCPRERRRPSPASVRRAVPSSEPGSSQSVTDANAGRRGIMRVGTIVLTACVLAVPLTAQNPAATASERDTAAKAAAAPIPKEASSVTDHTIRIGSQLVAYRATAATLLLKNDKDEAIGSLYYTAYTRTAPGGDPSQRPLSFIYNGGPGSASAWLHMGAFGPRRIVTTAARPPPPPPPQGGGNKSSPIDVPDRKKVGWGKRGDIGGRRS